MALIHSKNQSASLAAAIVGSVLGNCMLWYGISRGAGQTSQVRERAEIMVERITPARFPFLPKKVSVAKRTPIPPQPRQPAGTLKSAAPVDRKLVKDVPAPSQGAHHQVLVAKPTAPAPPSGFNALPAGHAPLGIPTDGQRAGSGVENPPKPAISTPLPVSPEQTPVPALKPIPTPIPEQKPEPVSSPPPVKKEDSPPPPKPKGLTQDAVATLQVNPEIPENLKSQTFKSHVRVRVTIAADGSFEVALRTSSGNADIDKIVLDALNKWKWKPALKSGETVDSIQLFRFDFSVE